MKRILSFLLILCMSLALLAGCGGQSAAPTQTTGDTTPETTEAPKAAEWLTGKEALQGKKIIFIGNSYTFFGQTVIHKGYDILSQAERSNDDGYFYHLCKANGIDVEVTNWTFGGHDITSIFGTDPCVTPVDCEGQIHQYFLQDTYFDYVAIQCYKEQKYNGDLVAHLQPVVDLFRAANPDVKFLLLVPHMAQEKNYSWVDDIEDVLDEGFRICDWGGLCNDLSKGIVQVPGGTLPTNRDTFVVSKDNHHENILAGYITTLSVYCAITGESAQGQPYDFCGDPSLHERFDLEAYRKKYYPDDPSITNFVEIMRSEADMAGIQKLVDQYLAKYNEVN